MPSSPSLPHTPPLSLHVPDTGLFPHPTHGQPESAFTVEALDPKGPFLGHNPLSFQGHHSSASITPYYVLQALDCPLSHRYTHSSFLSSRDSTRKIMQPCKLGPLPLIRPSMLLDSCVHGARELPIPFIIAINPQCHLLYHHPHS